MKRALGFRETFMIRGKRVSETEAAEFIHKHGPQPIWNSHKMLYAEGNKVFKG